MSHFSLSLESRSLTQPLLLRVKRIFEPSDEKRGNQSTVSPWVICFTSEPSVFIVKRSWLPARELDHTMSPGTFLPIATIFAFSASSGVSSEPRGGAPIEAQPESDARAKKKESVHDFIAVFLVGEARRALQARCDL